MLIRVLPLVAGIAPIAGSTVAYWLGVTNDILPSCIPYFDGCVSISATGRYMPGSMVFRAVMLPQSAVLVFVWYFGARWLHNFAPSRKAENTILIAGLMGAFALVVYVTFLGTKAPFYEFMRRFGIYLYFLGTAIAQVALAVALYQYAKYTAKITLRRLATAMLWLCGLPFAFGILHVVFRFFMLDTNFIQNRIEWNSALMMQGYFVVMYFAWRHTGFSIDVRSD